MPGIISSRIGHLGGSEIVEVEYDPSQTDLGQLAAALKKESSFGAVIVPHEEDRRSAQAAIPSKEIRVVNGSPHFIESKYSLRSRHPDLYYLDLTEGQAIALNSWSYFGGRMPDVLDSQQKLFSPQVKIQTGEEKAHRLAAAAPGKRA